MKTLLIVLALCLFDFARGQCVVDEVEYVSIYSDNHCTSSSLSNTKVILSLHLSQKHVGVFEWKIRKNKALLWEEIPSSWINSLITNELINFSVDSMDNYADFLVIFIENTTGCRDSATIRLVLDYSPSIVYISEIDNGQTMHFVENKVVHSNLSNEVTWFDHFGIPISTNDTLISRSVPCEVQIVDCVGCIERISINECKKKNISIFPNPADEYIYLYNNQRCLIELYDISGRLVEKSEVDGSELFTLYTKEYSNGLYLLRVCDESSIVLILH